MAVCVESLAHQQSLLTLFLDALLRRGIVSTHSIVQFVCPSVPVPAPGSSVHVVSPMHMSHLGDNIWVWSVSEIVVDRSLDIVVAAVGLYNSFKLSKQKESRLVS